MQLSSLSTEYIRVPVVAEVAGVPVNPTVYSVYMAIIPIGTLPAVADWKVAFWETIGGRYFAVLLVGPDGGVIAPAMGDYSIFVKIDAGIETPVIEAGFLEIIPTSTTPPTGLSPWATAGDLVCAQAGADPALVSESLQVATDILYEMSGRRFPGATTVTVRPCEQCSCGSTTRCTSGLQKITLSPRPVISIGQVKIDGEVVSPTEYRVDEWRDLVHFPLTANSPFVGWPCCQRMDLPSTEVGTFEVTFTYGKEPPLAGKRAAASLACEFVKAVNMDTSCRLPQRVQSVTRQGVSLVVLDPMDLFQQGKTGIPEVDLFLGAYNPRHLQRRAHVINVDVTPSVRRINT